MTTNEDTRKAVKFTLTDNQLRSLTVARYPQQDEKGKTTWVANPYKDAKGKDAPYTFLDGNPGAISGFGVYVGKRGASFRVSRRFGNKFKANWARTPGHCKST